MTELTTRPGWDTGDWTGAPPVAIHPYDPGWPARYEHARSAIARVLADLDIQIEHMGSTAVPGLGARNGIDILVGLGASVTAETAVARLQTIGLQHHFSKPEWSHLSGNGCKLHLTPLGSERWSTHVLFRDYLRSHPETMVAYDRLKCELALTFGTNGQRYVDGKTAFIQTVVEQARRANVPPGKIAPSAPGQPTPTEPGPTDAI